MAGSDTKAAFEAWLKRAILTLELAPGEDLDENRLGVDHGLSRTPVREVFRALDGLGYIELRRNKGARVADLSHTTLRDFFLAAPMIYGAILRLSAQNATEAQIVDLKAAQNDFRGALKRGNAVDRALANNRFHQITGEMAGNVYLLPSFHRLLIDHARIGMTFYRADTARQAENMARASAQHEAIIAAIEAGDEVEATHLADAHWDLSRGEIQMFVMPDALDGMLGTTATRNSA